MRQQLLLEGAKELEYEIRNIVKKAEIIQQCGQKIYWENIGDPIQKNAKVPSWMKAIVTNLTQQDESYGYCHSKGVLETREFLAKQTNELGGCQISAQDILFFNGLGDAIAKVYQYLHPYSRVIGPSPAYPTHSSAEAAHANKLSLTYKLDPDNHWYPDIDDLYNQVKYNPNIVGILIINPDNPTGMVYPREALTKIVDIAKTFNLFILSDEIYRNITYNGAEAIPISDILDGVPGIAMKGISKELPWPGARCGWMEFYNRDADPEFNRLCNALDDAKMIEVCSTTLPQKAIPQILSHEEFPKYRGDLNQAIGKRSKVIAAILSDVPYITFNETFGTFYNTIVFKPEVLRRNQSLHIENAEIRNQFASWLQPDMLLDKQFVYYLLAAKGVCVVPLSSFHSELSGFRVTLLEENESILIETFTRIKDALIEYCESDM